MLPSNQRKIKLNYQKEKKKSRDKWKWKHDDPKPVGCSKSSSKREVYSDTAYLRKQEKSQMNDLTL